MKVQISFGFALLISGLYFFDDAGLFGAVLLGIFFHELGHYLAIRAFRGRVALLKLTLTGLSMRYNETGMTYKKELVIALSGPAASLLLSVCASLMGKNAGSPYPYYVAGVSLIYFAFNMMPVRQLDGGRAICALFSLFLRVDTVERVLGVISCAAIFFLLVAGAALLIVSGRNISLLLAAVWLLIAYIRDQR